MSLRPLCAVSNAMAAAKPKEGRPGHQRPPLVSGRWWGCAQFQCHQAAVSWICGTLGSLPMTQQPCRMVNNRYHKSKTIWTRLGRSRSTSAQLLRVSQCLQTQKPVCLNLNCVLCPTVGFQTRLQNKSLIDKHPVK